MTGAQRRPRVGAAGGVTIREIEREVSREVARISDEMPPDRLPEKRCRVCQRPESLNRVNKLLAYGIAEFDILDLIEDLNATRRKNNKITIWSLRSHKSRHFNIQDPAAAGYRRILEHRKAQREEQLQEGVQRLLTGMGYLDIVAHKGFEHLMDDAKVDYRDGLQALLKLEEMTAKGRVEEEVAQMRRDVSLLQQVVSEVSARHPGMLQEISQRLDELRGTDRDEIIEAEVVDDDDYDDDEAFEPHIEADAEDPLED